MSSETSKMPAGRFILIVVIAALFFPALILGLGGNWCWLEGWLFALWIDAMILASIIRQYLKDPALLSERMKAPGSGNQPALDKVLQLMLYILGFSWIFVLPLDAGRFY